ncbi:hypothetical protein VCM39_12385 [Bacteroides sp. CG01]|uniref:hypothetical protein n=1 Tax=Bacteroides sp. CG01 TaxID=3096000 RepID=UPI002AFFD156|nr:hypothetical protein [Bacteroides sp. CG01]
MKIGLTIKAIIRWEQFRKKPFSLMDYANQEDVEVLLYTTTICNSPGKMFTFEVFRQTLSNNKITREMVMALKRETAVLAQFQEQRQTEGDTDIGSQSYIKDIVSTLIMVGLDASYALNEMELCDLPMYIASHEQQKKENMESSRLWTFFTMLPHIDAKKMKNGARDLIMFPWEEAEVKREAERAINKDSERFEKFMKTKKSDYNGR